MPPRKLNLERFSVSVPEHVKIVLERESLVAGQSLALFAGRILAQWVAEHDRPGNDPPAPKPNTPTS